VMRALRRTLLRAGSRSERARYREKNLGLCDGARFWILEGSLEEMVPVMFVRYSVSQCSNVFINQIRA
jgi:hypothetical protein